MTDTQRFQPPLSHWRMLAAVAAVTVGTGAEPGPDLRGPSSASAATRLGLDFNTCPDPSPSLIADGPADGAMGIGTGTDNGAGWSDSAPVNAYWRDSKGDASAVCNPDTKKVTMFARGGDGRIGYTQSGDDGRSWSNWAEVNAHWNGFSGDPHVIYNTVTKEMTVFARGGDGRIGCTRSGDDGVSWSDWAEVNAYWNDFSGDPHVVLNPDTHQMTVFARGGDGRMRCTRSGDDGASWSDWAEVNAYWNDFSGDPRPVCDAGTKTISLLARGGDGRIGCTRSGDDGANRSNWAEVNAYWDKFVGDPAATEDPDTARSTVSALGGGHMVYHPEHQPRQRLVEPGRGRGVLDPDRILIGSVSRRRGAGDPVTR